MKICRRCGELKSLEDFPKNKGAKDGFENICKICRAKKHKEWDNKNVEYLKKYRKEYRKNNLDKINERFKIWRRKAKNENKKNNCRCRTRLLVKKGKIKRELCAICGEKAQIHHHNYNDHLDITWLCNKHHVELHKFLNRKLDKENYLY